MEFIFLKNWKVCGSIVLFIVVGIVIGLCVAEFIFYKVDNNILSINNEIFYFNGTKLHNVYIVTNADTKISPEAKNVIITNNIILESKMVDDNVINNLDCIYFLSIKPTIDADLYEKIKNKIKYISSQKQCLIIKFKKEKAPKADKKLINDHETKNANVEDKKNNSKE